MKENRQDSRRGDLAFLNVNEETLRSGYPSPGPGTVAAWLFSAQGALQPQSRTGPILPWHSLTECSAWQYLKYWGFLSQPVII